MCSSSCIPLAADIECWTDEAVFMSLLNFKSGGSLPLNVTCDVNPYQYRPSDLPVDLWYFCSGVKSDTKSGFWVEKGVGREIFSNSLIIGLRTTLQFYEGRVPHEQKTDWMMQEFKIIEKCNNNTKDHRALCRVFLADENQPLSGHCIADIDVKISINLDNNTGSLDHFLENASEMDCIMRGDYFELNDLVDQGSRSSSSANSSCLTMTSDEYFDSMALLQELDDNITNQEVKHSSVKFNLSAPVKSKQVVLRPATSVSLRNNKDCKSSKGVNTRPSSSSSHSESTSTKGTDRAIISRTKRRKIIKYLCFLAF